MSEDETFITFLSLICALILWSLWFVRLLVPRRSILPRHSHWPLALAPSVSALLLFAVLRLFASHDVRDSAVYLFQYMVMGAAWVGVSVRFLSWSGVSRRDDVMERRNRAAEAVVAGSVVGLTFAYAGANIGEGPGWWVVVFCAFLSTAGTYFSVYLLAKVSGCIDFITIDRDSAAGLRLAGLIIAVGLILGRAVAGDWHSAQATVVDFAKVGWPALVIVVAEAIAAMSLRPTPDAPRPPVLLGGLLPALLYVGAAVFYVYSIGVYTPEVAEQWPLHQ